VNPNVSVSEEQAEEIIVGYLKRHRDYSLAWKMGHADSDYVIEPHYTTVLSFGLTPQRPTLWGLALTHMFLHGDMMHLIGNMLFIWLFGRAVEDSLGWWLYGLLYLAGGFAAAVLNQMITQAFVPESSAPLIGASGAISGLMGMFALRFYRTKIHVFYLILLLVYIRWGTFAIASSWGIALWILQDIGGGVLDLTSPERHGGVAHWAHLGGFGLGLLYATLIGFKSEGSAEYALTDAQEAYRLRRYHSAAQLCGQFLAKNSADYEAHLLRAQSLAAVGDATRAMPHYSEALKGLLQKGEMQRAGAILRQALALDSGFTMDSKTLFSLACRLAGAREHEAAAVAFRSFASVHPQEANAPWALVQAARIYRERLGREEEGDSLLQECRRLYPGNRWVTHA
jgi:membrane associated rhomboid family serine protease